MHVEWILCPICESKTRDRIREDTILKHYPLYCPKCKKETLIDAKNLKITVITEPVIDVTDVPEVKIGDSVIIFGEQHPVGPLADRLDTIPYELLTAVSPRVRRVYYSE